MGFELKRLMRERGVATPGMVPYSGEARPADLAADATPEQRAAFAESMRKYNLGQEAYNQYRQEYERRVSGTPQYLQSQFNTSTGANVPPMMTFSPAQMAALRPGSPNAMASNSLDRMNRDIRGYFSQNPNATAADIFKFREQYGLSENDIRNAMGSGFRYGQGTSGYGSQGVNTAMAPGGIGMDQYNANIRNWFAQNPNATPEQVAAAKAQYGVSDRDIYGATGSYFGNTLRAPTYNFAAAVDPNARSTIPTTPDRRTTLDTTTGGTTGGTVDAQVVVYGPDGTMYSSPAEARAAGVNNYTMTPPNNTAATTGGTGGSGITLNNNYMPTLPTLGGNPRLDTFDTMQPMSRGGIHHLAQKYNAGGAVRRFQIGGNEGEEDERIETRSFPVREPQLESRMLDKYDMLPDSVGNTPIGMNRAAPDPTAGMRSIAAYPPAATPEPVTASPAVQPVAPPPSATTPVSPAATDLMSMLQRYTSAESPYAADLAKARTKLDTESKAFENLLARAMKPGSNAPDKTELYFRLAAAFGSPSKTGRFTENLALAGREAAEYTKDVRAAKKAEQQLGLQLGLEAQKMRMQGAREELTALRGLVGEEMKDKRAVLLEYMKTGRPQSEAGKAAVDAGLTQGTPEFTNFVNKYIEDKIGTGNMLKEAMVAIAAGNLKVREKAEERATESAKKLTPAEVKLKTEAEDRLTTIDSAMTDLGRAFDLNKNSFDTTLKDTAVRTALEQTGSKDPKVVATRELENLLKSAMISSAAEKMKGVLSDSDIKLLQSVAGLDAKSREERAAILRNAYRSLRTARQAQQKKLNEISQGLYRETSPAPAGPGED